MSCYQPILGTESKGRLRDKVVKIVTTVRLVNPRRVQHWRQVPQENYNVRLRIDDLTITRGKDRMTDVGAVSKRDGHENKHSWLPTLRQEIVKMKTDLQYTETSFDVDIYPG